MPQLKITPLQLRKVGGEAFPVTSIFVQKIGESNHTEGALATILHQPFGRVLLALVAIGLAGYAFWRAVEGLADPEGHGTDAKGLVMRGRALVSAVIHVSLVISAVALVTGNGGGSGRGTEGWTAELMSQPFGRWLVGWSGWW